MIRHIRTIRFVTAWLGSLNALLRLFCKFPTISFGKGNGDPGIHGPEVSQQGGEDVGAKEQGTSLVFLFIKKVLHII